MPHYGIALPLRESWQPVGLSSRVPEVFLAIISTQARIDFEDYGSTFESAPKGRPAGCASAWRLRCDA